MSLIILFGLPGAGKSFIGHLCQQEKNHTHFDGDILLSAAMREQLANNELLTEEMRDELCENLIAAIHELTQQHPQLIVSQALPKKRNRQKILKIFPHAQFFLIEAQYSTRLNRIQKGHHPMTEKLLQKIDAIFESPNDTNEIYSIINNDTSLEILLSELFQKINIS